MTIIVYALPASVTPSGSPASVTVTIDNNGPAQPDGAVCLLDETGHQIFGTNIGAVLPANTTGIQFNVPVGSFEGSAVPSFVDQSGNYYEASVNPSVYPCLNCTQRAFSNILAAPTQSPVTGPFIMPFRRLLASSTAFYVAPNGSDTLGNGTAQQPWATPKGAIDILNRGFDLGGKGGHSINCSPGVYGSLVVSDLLPGQDGPLAILGNGSTFQPPSGAGAPVSLSDDALISLSGVTLDAQFSGTDCIQLGGGKVQLYGGVIFGLCPGNFHMDASDGTEIQVFNNYTIAGGNGALIQGHITVGAGARVVFENDTQPGAIQITVSTSLAMKYGFLCADGDGYIQIVGVPINLGSGVVVTGPRYLLQNGGRVNTAGSYPNPDAYLPGNAAGVNTGGFWS